MDGIYLTNDYGPLPNSTSLYLTIFTSVYLIQPHSIRRGMSSTVDECVSINYPIIPNFWLSATRLFIVNCSEL